jgi:hypothetical protein
VFELSEQKVTIAKYQPKAQKRNGEFEQSANLNFVLNTSADILAQFHPTLRSWLYDKDRGPRDGDDLVQQGSERLRFDNLGGPLHITDEMIGATLVIKHGLGGRSDLTLDGCKVHKLAVHPQDGGTVIVAFQVQCKPDEKQAGKLYGMQRTEQEISLTPPDPTSVPGPIETAAANAP